MTTISFAPAAFAPRTAALISPVYRCLASWKSGESPPTWPHLTRPATPSMSLMMWTRTARAYYPLMETGLAGKCVVVTGASGGIGSAVARAFAAEGARVVVHFHRNRENAEAVAADLGGAPVVEADLTDEAAVDHLFTRAREELGQVDVCAAVAGVWPRDDEPVWRLSLERWEDTLRANLTATFLTARAYLREVKNIGHGSLVLVGSTA